MDCNVDQTHFASGFDNLVVKITFSDNVRWVARIPHRIIDEGTRTSLLSEIATMRIIRKHTTIPIPQIFDFQLTTNRSFGYPYVLMEYLGGRTIDNGLARGIPPKYHPKVAKQFANVFTELENLTFDRIGRLWCGQTTKGPVVIIPMAWHESPGPLETSLEYFYNQRQAENRDAITMHPNDPDWLTACWVLKVALSHIIVEDRVRGPFPLCHLDLHRGNLLFDDDYNMTGVLDWSSSQAAPIEQMSVCPELVTFPGLSEEQNRPIVEFKKLVLQFIKETEEEKRQESDNATPEDDSQVDMTQSTGLAHLSTYMASKSAEITHRHYMASPSGTLWAGQMVAKLMYGQTLTWEQLREVYGTMPLF